MKRFLLLVLLVINVRSFGAECHIDGQNQNLDNLVSVVSGYVKGFDPGPVYVTVTSSDGRKYTTLVNREGKYSVIYSNLGTQVEVLCWQGWNHDTKEAKAIIK